MNVKGRAGWWTDERTETARSMWIGGYSAGQVAVALGEGSTRNGVIGKMHRLGLEKRSKSSQSSVGRRQRAVERDKRRSAIPLPPRLKLAAGQAWKALPGSTPVPLEELSRSGCRWPIGDEAPFLFCSEPSVLGRHYCEAHCSMSAGRGTESERNAVKVLRREVVA